jgi:hypothetical protein
MAGWQNFYVIVGSAAGALIGLEFVVITLVTSVAQHLIDRRTLRAFATPAVIYMTSVLLVAALLNVPRIGPGALQVVFMLSGAIGVAYIAWVALHLHRADYALDLEDRAFYVGTPAVSYGALFVAGLFLGTRPAGALQIIAAASMLLMITGIHNTWDAAVWTISTAANPDAP